MSDFSFAFSVEGEPPAAATAAPAPLDPSCITPPSSAAARYAVVVSSGAVGFASSLGDSAFARGDIVCVDWHATRGLHAIAVERVADGVRGEVAPSRLALLGPRDAPSSVRDAALHDAVTWSGSPAAAAAAAPSLSSPFRAVSPLLIEPGLASLVWPLSPAAFLEGVFRARRVFSVHSLPSRLAELAKDFDAFDVPRMLASASRLVVWMRDAHSGRMQYLEAGPDIALACWSAGHTCYFNPSVEVQRRYLAPLLGDLGLDVLCGGGGSEEDDLGGDIEVFAVRGRHATPWHFDAQENFTVQLRGTKTWRLLAGVASPLANAHPHSSNAASRAEDDKVHASYLGGAVPQPPSAAAAATATVVVMRPGSVLYLPAGHWHSVEADDAEGGSLSLNFSLAGVRWGDLLVRRLLPLLWRDERWRARVAGAATPDAVRSHLAALLRELPAVLARVSAEELLPEGVFPSGRARRVIVDSAAAEALEAAARGRRARRRLQAAEEDEGTDAAALAAAEQQGLAAALSPATVLMRCTATTLVVAQVGDSGAGGGGGSVVSGSPLPANPLPPRVRATIHAGFGSVGGEGTYRSDWHVDLEAASHLAPALAAVAALPHGATARVSDLAALSGAQGSAAAALSEGGEEEGDSPSHLEVDVDTLLRVLIHNGVLRAAAVGGV